MSKANDNTCPICCKKGHAPLNCPIVDKAAQRLAEKIDQDILDEYKKSIGLNADD